MRNIKLILLVVAICVLSPSLGDKKHRNKYSKESNAQPTRDNIFTTEKYDPTFRDLQKPFRIAKLNLVWSKAQHRLTEPKLKSLYMELKIHDKEEIAWKQLNSQHKDKDGLKAATLRQKLIGIMSTYDLLDHFEETQDPEKTKPYRKFHDKTESHLNKSQFKDKKLNKLWEKAEISGFNEQELNALKEEFQHHQEKVDVYYNLLENLDSAAGKSEYHENAVNEDELEQFNEISTNDELDNNVASKRIDQHTDNVNQLREHHRGVKDNIDRLERLVSRGPDSQDFIEPKVQGLWRIALNSNFTEKELSSIKSELHHFETRLLKLRHLHSEHALHQEKYKNEKHKDNKRDRFEDMEQHIKKQIRKVEKLQESIEMQIFKHSEL